MIKLFVFIFLSIGAIISSRDYLFKLQSHGFYRLLAFEAILALLLLNVDKWLSLPTSLVQIISWSLLLLSAVLASHGFYLLFKYGQAKDNIENTTALVRKGVFRFIRHPLYASLLFFAWGVYFKHPSFFATLLSILCSIFLILTAKVEEKEMLVRFGREYEIYMEKTWMFIPYLY